MALWLLLLAFIFVTAIYVYFDIPFWREKLPTIPPSPPGKKVKQTYTTWKEDKINHTWLGFNLDGKLVVRIHRKSKEGYIDTKLFTCHYEDGERETYLSLKQAKAAVHEYNWFQRLKAIQV